MDYYCRLLQLHIDNCFDDGIRTKTAIYSEVSKLLDLKLKRKLTKKWIKDFIEGAIEEVSHTW